MNNKSGLKYQSWSRTQSRSQQKVLSKTTPHLGVVSFAGLFGSCCRFWRAWMVRSWCLSTGFAPSDTAGCWFWRCWFLENESFTCSYYYTYYSILWTVFNCKELYLLTKLQFNTVQFISPKTILPVISPAIINLQLWNSATLVKKNTFTRTTDCKLG